MPYIDNAPALSPYKIREGELQKGFKDLLLKHGWTKALEFKKMVTSVHFVTEHDVAGRHDDRFLVANHVILRNARGDLLGLAVVADWGDYTDHANGFPYYNVFNSTDSEKEALTAYMSREFYKRKEETTLYFYMLDRIPNIKEGSNIFTPWGTESEGEKRLRMALDVEVTSIDFKSTNAGSEFVKSADPLVMQSPIVESSLRAKFLENLEFPYMDTNWWGDSEISIRGHLDSKSMFLILQADVTPMWEDNVVPSVPLYFGDIEAVDEGDPAVAMFAGTVPMGSSSTEVSHYDFDNITLEGGKRIMPVLKKYPSNPSNGIDSVLINRTKLGARYQSYFLSWSTAAQDMPPTRDNGNSDDLKDYPRAWGRNGYQFNPSRYSGKVQTSHIYLIHPEEGVRGHLSKAVGLNATNLNSSELRILRDSSSETVYDVYQCVPISAVSPLTKRPATHFRPMGLGIYKEELNQNVTVKPNPTDKEAPGNVNDLKLSNPQPGQVKLSWSNPSDTDLAGVEILLNGEEYVEGVTGVTEYVFKGLSAGEVTFKVVSVDYSGNKSTGSEVTGDVS
ncbi:hypothetical protein [Bacillus subtilis]|uniref:hypothetical protein n=1 Tax=Bacillus subtilis TaxID=1423 RepID=UPI000A102F7E|nr:hypothetical protein [Bacillus subtilis]MEC4031934.1 hypothetical protein [Bacillus subtilis]